MLSQSHLFSTAVLSVAQLMGLSGATLAVGFGAGGTEGGLAAGLCEPCTEAVFCSDLSCPCGRDSGVGLLGVD